MRTLHQQNFNNARKYSALDNAERIAAEKEDEILFARIDAECRQEEAERNAREPMVVKGLTTKYGMSEAGAQTTLSHIKRDTLEFARFATPEMEKAAKAAYKFYWTGK